jgi:hypothetical protein
MILTAPLGRTKHRPTSTRQTARQVDGTGWFWAGYDFSSGCAVRTEAVRTPGVVSAARRAALSAVNPY